jgi:hypothetical protein
LFGEHRRIGAHDQRQDRAEGELCWHEAG